MKILGTPRNVCILEKVQLTMKLSYTKLQSCSYCHKNISNTPNSIDNSQDDPSGCTVLAGRRLAPSVGEKAAWPVKPYAARRIGCNAETLVFAWCPV